MKSILNTKVILKSLVFIIPIALATVSKNTKSTPLMPTPFITEWDVNGSMDTTTFFNTITIPLQSGRTYDFDYTWTLISNTSIQISGTHTNANGDFTTDFTTGEFWELSIDGQFPHMKDYPKDKLLDVIQWGDIVWESMVEMFRDWLGTGFSATDAPDLSSVTSMNRAFDSAINFNEDLDHWDVSNVQNMFRLFQSCSSFNGDVSNWDLSQATVINNIFNGASSFNQDISGWEFPLVNTLNGVFRGATNFNQDISDWDVSNITSMIDLFFNADSFNQDISNWDVSKVNSFREIFRNNDGFNQSLGNWKFKAGANFREFFVNATAMDCQSWSSSILGWYYSNPDIINLDISDGTASFEFDSIASIARDKLINEQGWQINGTPIGGECGAAFEFPCSDTLQFQNDTLFGNLILPADLQVDLINVNIIQPSDVTVKAPIVNIDALSEIMLGAKIEVINTSACN